MCGIVGCYQQADGRRLVEIMSERVAHRGPDAAGIWAYDQDRVTAQLGHRRLSIIDLSDAADQPLSKHGITHPVGHRGRARGVAVVGTGGPAPVPRHVRVRAARRAHR
jgi:asparagine synthetase B (glutamine-hydrolysing)